MISPTLATLSDDLLRAAARRNYADVERLAVSIGAAAAREARSLPAGDPAFRAIGEWLKALYARTEILLRIARASQATDLRQVSFLQRYLPARDRRAEHVKLAL